MSYDLVNLKLKPYNEDLKKKLLVFHKEFDRVKFSLYGQYWNKYASSVNIENALLFINENMQDNVLHIMELCRMLNIII